MRRVTAMATLTPELNAYLSCLLDDVTGTEEIVKTRQNFCIALECLTSNHSYYTGSKAEGLDLVGSDDDFMYDINKPYDINAFESLQDMFQSTRIHKFLIVTDNVPPGFIFLKCISQIHHRHLFHSLVNINDSMYISSQLFVSSTPDLKLEGDTQRIQGPSVEITSQYDDKSKSGMDNVLSIRCRFWPKIAAEWIDRPRHYGWPSLQDKEKIVEFGCHLVPIGHPTSPMKPLQWRISFSIAERTLVWSFNHTQMQCYAVMKLILKEYIKKKCSEENRNVFCSYFIKTFLFWQFEAKDAHFWQTNNLNGCLIYLLRGLYKCIRTGVLRHYFIPRFNLLEIKLTSEAKQELLKILDFVISDDLNIFSYCSSLSDVWLKFLRGRDRNQIETHELRRSQILENEYAMMNSLNVCHIAVRFIKHSSVRLGVSLVKLENEIIQDVSNTSLLLMCFRSVCGAITVNKLYYCHRENKSLYKHIRALDKNLFGVDISSSQFWLATFRLQYKDYFATLKIVNNIFSAMPPFAIYCSGRHIHTEYPSAYRDICYLGNESIVSKAKKVWLCDLKILPEDFHFMPRAIQIELLHYDQEIGVTISPFVYAYYLMFLCYHELGQYDNRDRALCQLVETANDRERCGVAKHHSYNIAGHCLLVIEHVEMARDFFSRQLISLTKYMQLSINKTPRIIIYLSYKKVTVTALENN